VLLRKKKRDEILSSKRRLIFWPQISESEEECAEKQAWIGEILSALDPTLLEKLCDSD